MRLGHTNRHIIESLFFVTINSFLSLLANFDSIGSINSFGNRFNLRELSDQDLFIPGNDDGTQSVELFFVAVADAILDGLEAFQSKRDADYAVKQEILRANTTNTESIGSRKN